MKKLPLFLLCTILFSSSISLFAQDDLDKYVSRMRTSKKNGDSETGFMSAGSDFLYGFDFYEARNYSSAFNYFTDVIRKDNNNAYANYLAGVSLMKQNDKYKAAQAQDYLKKAFQLNPSLKNRYAIDVPNAANVSINTSGKPNSLDAYIEKLKYSRSTGGEETRMLSSGREVIAGIEYFEQNDFKSALTSFSLGLAKDPDDVYANYLKGFSLAAIGKPAEAKPYLSKAFAGDRTLEARYIKDLPAATKSHKALEEQRKLPPSPVKQNVYGGKLLFGNYTCSQTVWNGPNTSPAYSYASKGYFELKADGSYRWLDNGASGKYKYDAATGSLIWLSGFFKDSGVKTTQYQTSNSKTGQLTINFTDSYRWECGCKK